jgi:hypothetical protein
VAARSSTPGRFIPEAKDRSLWQLLQGALNPTAGAAEGCDLLILLSHQLQHEAFMTKVR